MKKHIPNEPQTRHLAQHGPGLSLLLETNDVSGLAYHFYERDGRPDGKHLEHWFNAESTIENNFAMAGIIMSQPSTSQPEIVNDRPKWSLPFFTDESSIAGNARRLQSTQSEMVKLPARRQRRDP